MTIPLVNSINRASGTSKLLCIQKTGIKVIMPQKLPNSIAIHIKLTRTLEALDELS